ncbi:MAG TPA: PAS domain S-box protein [Pyrinomonadaceae bacterium]|jgi:PAS domain S-box-containing protein|nr:PAS domain S-box protein [Pyrinomonadaceae bacterium]
MDEPRAATSDTSRRLAEINRAITTSLNFDEVLNLITENAAQLVSARVSVLLLMDNDGVLTIRAARGAAAHLVRDFSGRMEERVIEQLRVALRIGRDETIVSLPIVSQRVLTGLLLIARVEPLDADEQWQLSALADQAAIALQNARLYEMELAEAARARDISQTAVRHLGAIVESSGDAIISKDLNAIIESWNQGAERIFGFTAAEAIGRPITILIPDDRQNEETEILGRIKRGESVDHFETVRNRKDGSPIDVSITVSPIKNDRGEIIGASKIARDITESKRAQEQLQRALDFDQTVMLSMGEGLYTVDTEGRLTFMNPAAQRIFGWSLDEIIGRHMHDVTHHTYQDGRPFPREECAGLKVLREGKALTDHQDFFIRRDGTFFDVVYSSSALRSADKLTGLVVVFRDITERKRAEEEIRFQARLLDAVEQAVIATDVNGIIMFWNSFAETLYGWSAAEALGANILDLTPSPTLREKAGEILAALKSGKSWTGEFEVRRRDGTLFPALITDSPIINVKGELVGFVGVSTDNTTRRQIEQERENLLGREREARAESEAANRLKDEFLATLSHELRNPLNVVIGYSEILRRSSENLNQSFVIKAAETIRRNALAQSQLVSDLLDLSRLQMGKLSLDRRPLSLSTVVTEAVETVSAEAREKGISIEVELGSEVLVVEGDAVRLAQITWNLLNNAVKFTSENGKIQVALKQDGEQGKLVVTDSGQGIAPEFLSHVFEMFRQQDASSSRRQGGMGIGLALVKQLTELHDGHVQAYSRGVDQGASFTVWIPLFKAGSSGLKSERVGATGALRSKFILVVDDSTESTEMLGKLLEIEGAFVDLARNGAEALAIANRKRFDLVISDISMPEMDGYELLRELRKLPQMGQVPAVALTGFGRDADIERAHAEGFAEHLTKPIDIDQLLVIVRRLTGENGDKSPKVRS